MNHHEKLQIQRKINDLQVFIKEQHRLPKKDRNKKRLTEALKKSEVMNRWLKE